MRTSPSRFPIAALSAAALAAGSAAVFLARAGAARAEGPPPIKIGVFDLATVFKGYKKSKELEQRITDERDALKRELDDLGKQIMDITKELDMLDRATQAYELKEEELKVVAARRELKKDRFENRLRKRWEEYNLEILDDIEAAVRAFGEKNGFSLILKVEGKPLEDSRYLTGEVLLAAKASKSVLYAAPEIDISREIVEELNRRFDLGADSRGETGSGRPVEAGSGAGGAASPRAQPPAAAPAARPPGK